MLVVRVWALWCRLKILVRVGAPAHGADVAVYGGISDFVLWLDFHFC